jgi:hypothetical protein
MADHPDLKDFVHERFRRVDAKLDKVIDALAEVRTHQAAMLQILASQDSHMLRMEVRLGDIEKRLSSVDPAIPADRLQRYAQQQPPDSSHR